MPITGQTLGVLLAGTALGWKRGLTAMVLYGLAGVIGVPWFAGHSSGYVGASFGYIVGFALCAALCGWLAERRADRSLLRSVPAMVAGEIVMYTAGVVWLGISLHVGAGQAIALGLTPFLIGDAIKAGLAAALLPAAWRLAGCRAVNGLPVNAAAPRSFQLGVPGGQLAGDVWPGAGPTVILLHSGVGDRRSWQDTAPRLAPGCRVVTYDRRGSGDSPPAAGGFTHLDDLAAVLDLTAASPVWLVGRLHGRRSRAGRRGELAGTAGRADPDRAGGSAGRPKPPASAPAATGLACCSTRPTVPVT